MISAAHMIGGMLRYKKFLKKMCNLMRLGKYFDHILYKNFFLSDLCIEQCYKYSI